MMGSKKRTAMVFPELAVMGMGIVYLRIGTVCRVEVDGEQMYVVSRFGRAAKFSVRDVSSVSGSPGWTVLYDREFQTLAKVDSCLGDMDRLKGYLETHGIKMEFPVWNLKKAVKNHGTVPCSGKPGHYGYACRCESSGVFYPSRETLFRIVYPSKIDYNFINQSG